MEEKINQFLTKNVDIFERILVVLWKKNIVIKEKLFYPQENKFIIEFITIKKEHIRLELLVTLDRDNKIDRIGAVYKWGSANNKKTESYLALSFLYHCPYELELCNQYGLYTKKVIQKIKNLKNIDKIRKYQLDQNLLKNNRFFIFNMGRIKEHCADKALDELLHSFHEMIEEWNQQNV